MLSEKPRILFIVDLLKDDTILNSFYAHFKQHNAPGRQFPLVSFHLCAIYIIICDDYYYPVCHPDVTQTKICLNI